MTGPHVQVKRSFSGLLKSARVRAGYPSAAFMADWAGLGRKAGPIRNERMLTDGDPELVVAFPGGRGTAHLVRIARDASVEVVEIA